MTFVAIFTAYDNLLKLATPSVGALQATTSTSFLYWPKVTAEHCKFVILIGHERRPLPVLLLLKRTVGQY